MQNLVTRRLDLREILHQKDGLLNSESSTSFDRIARTDIQGSAISGNSVQINAGNDITVQASQIAAMKLQTVLS